MRREANPGQPGLTGAGGPQSKHPHSYNVDKYNFYDVYKYNFYNVDKYNFYDIDKYSFYGVISKTFDIHHVDIVTFIVAMMFTNVTL